MSTMFPGTNRDEAAYVRSNHTKEASHNPGVAIQENIVRPGAVRINVTGAFIVEEEIPTSQALDPDGVIHETSDIRLPHHTSVVSHVAVDVWRSFLHYVVGIAD